MLRTQDVSIFLLTVAFIFIFLGSFTSFPFSAYLAATCYVLSLFLYKKISPILFFSLGSICIFLAVISPSAFLVAALIPLVGFLFSGENKNNSVTSSWVRYSLWISVAFMYLAAITQGTDSAGASHNQLSEIVAMAIIAELLYFSGPSKLYIPLIFISFFLFGNRSAFFLLATYIKSKAVLLSFVIIAVFFVSITNGYIEPPDFLDFLYQDGGLLFRSFKESRGDYVDEFMTEFNLFDLRYDHWNFSNVPQTTSGFYDLHNSFLTIIVRDSYLGLFKVILWSLQIFFIPLGLFIGVSLRAAHDTFLLGSVNDIVIFALFGRSFRDFGNLMITFFKMNISKRI
jgi:hypothetical protein